MNKFEIGESELSFFKGEAGYSACFTPNAISSYWWTTGRLGELILMLENVKIVHTMGHLMCRFCMHVFVFVCACVFSCLSVYRNVFVCLCVSA